MAKHFVVTDYVHVRKIYFVRWFYKEYQILSVFPIVKMIANYLNKCSVA